MRALMLIANAFMIPVFLLNLLGGVVGGVWLAALGDWGSIGWGVGAMAVGGFAVSIALLPGVLLAGPAVLCINKGWNVPAYGLLLLSNSYTSAVMAAWCLGTLLFFGGRATTDSAIPLLLWSYSVGTGVWTWLARKDSQGGGGEASLVSAFFLQIAFIIAMTMIYFFRPSVIDIAVAIVVVMGLNVVVAFMSAIGIHRQMRLHSH